MPAVSPNEFKPKPSGIPEIDRQAEKLQAQDAAREAERAAAAAARRRRLAELEK